jgi:hypothetical protein
MHHAQQRGVDDISRRRDSSRAGLVQDLRDVRSWHIASFRGDATIQSLSERSGHSASRDCRTGFMSTRPSQVPSLMARECEIAVVNRHPMSITVVIMTNASEIY